MKKENLLLPLFYCLVGSGCATQTNPNAQLVPIVTGLTPGQASVGDPVEILGRNFPVREDGWLDVVFNGQFYPDDNTAPQEVKNLKISLAEVDGRMLWDRFGAYRIPFSEHGDQIGVFQGTVCGTSHFYQDNSLTFAQPEETCPQVSFRVLPSIIVLDFRAVGDDEAFVADCKYPATNAIQSLPYILRLKCVGCQPYYFDTEISEGLVIDDVPTDRRTSVRLGVGPEETQRAIRLKFAPVPDEIEGYRVEIQVQAPTIDGSTRKLSFLFIVRNPLAVFFREPAGIAEIFPPVQVSSCIGGGPYSVKVSYSEEHSETRTRTTELSFKQGWQNGYGQQHGSTWGVEANVGDSHSEGTKVTVTDATKYGFSESTTDLFSQIDNFANARDNSNGESNGGNSGVNSEFAKSLVEQFKVSQFGGSGDDKNLFIAKSYKGSGSGSEDDKNSTKITLDVENGQTIMGQGGFTLGPGVSGQSTSGTSSSSVLDYAEAEKIKKNGSGTDISGSGGMNTGDTQTNGGENGSGNENFRSSSYSRSQSYAEANAFTTTDSLNRVKNYSQARTDSRNVNESLAQMRSEGMTVTTSKSTVKEFSTGIAPNNQGQWYRQTFRYLQYGAVAAYDMCGNATPVGVVTLTNWAWAAGLVQAPTCPVPTTGFPKAECFVDQCIQGH